MSHMNHLLCFGFGLTAQTLASLLPRDQWKISGTTRNEKGLAAIAAQDVTPVRFDQLHHVPDDVTHILSSVPPDENGDPVLARFASDLQTRNPKWVAYLSTTGVYGDHQGGWVDEQTPLTPQSARARRRVEAEGVWQALGLPLHIFRLPGIYGPGRNQLVSVLDGTARRIVKPGHVFCRIHVEDIAGVLLASINAPNPGQIYNVTDDEPCPPQDVVAYAAKLLELEPPPEIPLAEARLTGMAASFYAESKRVSNARIKQELSYQLRYPTYREGLVALLPAVRSSATVPS
jgi:nucleoside-diphosphate-sugar epimerase